MPTEDVAYQQRLKIRRTTLGFGVIQVLLGLALTGLSFTAFVLSESEKIRNACPYWAGFTVFCSGGVGIVAWRYTTVLSMGLFTFFSAVCVVLHMIGTILTGEIGGLLKSIIMCQRSVINSYTCECCDSIMTCKQNVPTFQFEGVEECSIVTGLMKELMYGLCVLNIFGSLVCFIATILGCTSVARQAGRDQPLFRRRLSARSDSHEQSQYSWLHYPTDLNILPPYAPPIYRSVDNVQDCGATPYIVPPPVFDPTDLPPPYSSRNASLSSSGLSLNISDPTPQRGRPHDRDDSAEGGSAIVLSEGGTVIHHHYENHYQQRVYSENRARPGHPVQITNVVLTRNGILERCGTENRTQRTAIQSVTSLNSSRASLQSEARISIDRIERQLLQRCEKAEECKEESDEITTSQERMYKSKQSSRMRCLSTVEQSSELIMFEESRNKRNSKEIKRPNYASKSLERKLKSSKVTEDEFSSTSDSGIGEELTLLYEPADSTKESNTGTNKEHNNASANCTDDGGGSEDVLESVIVNTSVKQCDTDCEPKHLVLDDQADDSIRDNISLDIQLENHDLQPPMSVNDTTECHIQTSEHCRYTEERNENDVGSEGDLINREIPTDLPVESSQGSVSIGASEAKEDSVSLMLDSGHQNDIQQLRSHWDETSRNVSHEEGSDCTEEVIRLMDNFITTKSSTITRTHKQDIECDLNWSRDTRNDVKSLDLTRMTGRGMLASIPERSTTSYANPLKACGQNARSLTDFPRILHLDKSESAERNKSGLAARSDSCMTFSRTKSREISTALDPSGSGFKYFGCHRPTFIPPNIELPMEIRGESLSHGISVTESKRRKRHSARELPRPKRRALGNKNEFMRMKSRGHHKLSRKDETSRLRERHLKKQNARVRDEISRSYWQAYNGKCSLPKARDEWRQNPAVWTSLKKRKNEQRFRGNIGLHTHTKQLPIDVNTSSECMSCTGKETVV